jgi:hemoglobin-like flavoprotein
MAAEPALKLNEQVSINSNVLRTVESSYARCLNKNGFLNRFYEIFMASHPDVKPHFAHTDLNAQIQLLRHGLMSVFMFAEQNPIGQKALTRIRESHKRTKLNIAPNLYQHWTDSLIKTVSEFDGQFNAELERAWRQVIRPATDYIKSGYED